MLIFVIIFDTSIAHHLVVSPISALYSTQHHAQSSVSFYIVLNKNCSTHVFGAIQFIIVEFCSNRSHVRVY